MSDHADIGPSALDRILNCPGSFALAGEVKSSPSSAYSREGTAAHMVASVCLVRGTPAAAEIGTEIVIEGESILVDADMAEHIQVYLDYCRRLHSDEQWVETKLTIETLGTFGTADYMAYNRSTGGLHIVDLKYGAGVKVDVKDNPQLMAYAVGGLEMLELSETVDSVTVHIVQPRIDNIDSQTFASGELIAWATSAAEVIAQARAGKGPLKAGDHCRWCPAKPRCPELRNLTQDTTGITFEDLSADGEGQKIAATLDKLDLIEDWVTAYREYARDRLQAGVAVPGYKLVEGRRGNRAWTSTTEVEDLLRKKFRLSMDEVYERKLIGPPAAQKLLSKWPKRWSQLQALITQSAGKPTVAPEDDKRPPIITTAVSFDDLSQEDK